MSGETYTPVPMLTLAQKLAPFINASAASVTASGSTTARTLAARAGDAINVLDYGIAPGAGDQSSALQSLINTYPAGAVVRLLFPRVPGQATTLYQLAGPVRSNGRQVHCTFEDSADIQSTGGYLAVDRIDICHGWQRYVGAGFSNGYFGSSSGFNVSYGFETWIWNYSGANSQGTAGGPNVNAFGITYTDTRYFSTGGGQLALLGQRVMSTPNLTDGTSSSLFWDILLGPLINEVGWFRSNLVNSPLGREMDVAVYSPQLPLTDQAGYMTPGGCILISAGGSQKTPGWGYIAGNLAYGYRVAGGASGASYANAPALSDLWWTYPAVFGAVNPAAVSTGNAIVITDPNGTQHTVTLNGGGGTGSLADVAASINAANVPYVQAQVSATGASSQFNRLVVYCTKPRDAGTFGLANGSGTPLATLGLPSGTQAGGQGPYATVVSKSFALSGQVVAPASQMVVCGTAITLSGGGGNGSLADIAASINTVNVYGVTAQVAQIGAQGRLVIQAYLPQQPAGLVLANSTNSPLATLDILPGTYSAPTPPHAFAVAMGEAVGAGAVFASGDQVTIGYSLPTSNTTEAGAQTITVGTGALGVLDAASAINAAVATAGWVVSTASAGSTVSQGAPVVQLASVAGIYTGMPVIPSAYFNAGIEVLDVNVAASAVTLTGGTSQAMPAGTTVAFGLVKAEVYNAGSSGAALIVTNCCGGSLWIADATGTPCERAGLIPGQHWPGAMPPGFQNGFIAAYGSIAPGGSGVRLGGALVAQVPDPVQWPDSPIRIDQGWRHGIRLDQAAISDNVALRLAPGQTVTWAPPGSSGGVSITSGAGAPTATLPNGSMYLRSDSGAGSSWYRSTGSAWVAVA
jgi:hypothetical protein